jgi:hypothetical protein
MEGPLQSPRPFKSRIKTPSPEPKLGDWDAPLRRAITLADDRMQTINNEQSNSGINTIFMALLPKRNERFLLRIPGFLAFPPRQ